MAIVRSFGSFQAVDGPRAVVSSAPRSYSSLDYLTPASCAAFYRSQPNIRTVVDFLARNVAELECHTYRRVSDLDRERLSNHQFNDWLDHPNHATVRYRLIETLMQDLGIYFEMYWLKVRLPERIGFVRLSPETVTPIGGLLPWGFAWMQENGYVVDLAYTDVVHINGFDPANPLRGLSPIETLRRILLEDVAASASMTAFWQNSARLEGVIERPLGAPKWSKDQKDSWREQWRERYQNQPGGTPVLEDGMTYKQASSNARDAELTPARKLTREECAAAYHVPLPMVGILDHATFSNIKEQHKQLYQDCLGPWLKWLKEEFERQILSECRDIENVYLEFNIAEKLKGSFEEQAASLQTLVGRPVMTVNEGRARLNLPSIKDDPSANAVAAPLNMSAGGTLPLPTSTREPSDVAPEATALVIGDVWARQRARLDKVPKPDRAATFESSKWDRELARALEPLYLAVGRSPAAAAQLAAQQAATVNSDTLQLLVRGEDAFNPAREAALYVA